MARVLRPSSFVLRRPTNETLLFGRVPCVGGGGRGGREGDVEIALVSSLVIAICGNGRNWFSFLRFTDFCIGHCVAV